MVKHIQTIRRQFADELFECVWLFCEIGAKRVNLKLEHLFAGNARLNVLRNEN